MTQVLNAVKTSKKVLTQKQEANIVLNKIISLGNNPTEKEQKNLIKDLKLNNQLEIAKNLSEFATMKIKENKKATKKKAVKKSESVILKTQVNNNWKENTRSLSALVKYCKGEGTTDIQKMLDATNKSKGTKVNIKQVANIKNITRLATERELNYNLNPDKTKGAKFIKGEQKRLFSLWLVLLTIGRLANEEAEINKAKK